MNLISDYDLYFCPIATKIHIGPIYPKTHIFLNILTQKLHFADTHVKRKLTFFKSCLCLSNALSQDLGTGVSRLASQWTFKWSYR